MKLGLERNAGMYVRGGGGVLYPMDTLKRLGSGCILQGVAW